MHGTLPTHGPRSLSPHSPTLTCIELLADDPIPALQPSLPVVHGVGEWRPRGSVRSRCVARTCTERWPERPIVLSTQNRVMLIQF